MADRLHKSREIGCLLSSSSSSSNHPSISHPPCIQFYQANYTSINLLCNNSRSSVSKVTLFRARNSTANLFDNVNKGVFRASEAASGVAGGHFPFRPSCLSGQTSASPSLFVLLPHVKFSLRKSVSFNRISFP